MFWNKRAVKLNVKINILSIRHTDRKERIKEIMKEIQEIREEYPDIKIDVEVNG